MDIIKYYTESVSTYRTAPAAGLELKAKIDDPVARPFLLNAEQRATLQKKRTETMSHVFARDAHGKIELVALDDTFTQLQAEISDLETKISKNTAVVEELGRVFEKFEIEEPSLWKLRHDRPCGTS